VYNPEVVSLNLLIELYFKTIDPTSLNKQGNDRGTRYRTGIYYSNKFDLSTINAEVDKIAKDYQKPIVVEVKPLKNFIKPKITIKTIWEKPWWLLPHRTWFV
jgi:peptide methionine sulfoxide reductase msrA/msrB